MRSDTRQDTRRDTIRIDADAPEHAGAAPTPAIPALKRAPEGAHFFTKDEIMGASDITYEDIPVPEWGAGYVRVRGLTGGERSEIEAQLIEFQKDGTQKFNGRAMRQLFCAYAIIDPRTGRRLFNNQEIHYLAAKSAAALDRVYSSVTSQSRFSQEDLKELEGNSEPAPSDASSGGSENAGAVPQT